MSSDPLSVDPSSDDPLSGAFPDAGSGEGAPSDLSFGGQDGEAVDPNAVFDQESIDSFLGFGGGFAPLQQTSGIDALVHTTAVPNERRPMLEAVFDRLGRLLRISTRKILSDMVEVNLERVAPQRFGQYMSSIPLPSLIAIVKTHPWNSLGLLTAHSDLVYALVDVLFGGNADLGQPAVEGRSFSAIDMGVMERFIGGVLKDLGEAFRLITAVDFTFDHFETNPRFSNITQPKNVAIVATFKIELGALVGSFDIVLPLVTLEPIRAVLNQGFTGERQGTDDNWQRNLTAEIMKSRVPLSVVLSETSLPLGRVLRLAVGETLMLDAAPDQSVQVRCGDKILTTGRMGRSGDFLAVKLDAALGSGGLGEAL